MFKQKSQGAVFSHFGLSVLWLESPGWSEKKHWEERVSNPFNSCLLTVVLLKKNMSFPLASKKAQTSSMRYPLDHLTTAQPKAIPTPLPPPFAPSRKLLDSEPYKRRSCVMIGLTDQLVAKITRGNIYIYMVIWIYNITSLIYTSFAGS